MNQVKLGEAEALFSVLRQSADADVVAAIEALVRDAPDPALNRINVLDFAAQKALEQERVIAAFLHAARVGLFELSLQLPQQFVIVFEPVTHSAQFLDVKGEPTRERQNLSVVFNKVSAPVATLTMRPGPLRLSLENRTDVRVLPGVWIAGDKLHDL